ncbi:hypothetical protein ACTXGK_11785 [Psychrobacter sp. T6-5]|uniref:hypothetical protein n=1 Tax=Psychrobacter sp. T6-5 TaxID=3457451 RepID=UPI003FD3093F
MNASLLSHTIDKNKTKDNRLIAATAYRYSDMSYQHQTCCLAKPAALQSRIGRINNLVILE